MMNKKSQAKGFKLARTSVRKSSNVKRTPLRRVSRRPATVGLASAAANPMRSLTVKSGRGLSGASCRIHGTDYLTAITAVSGGQAAGDVIYTADVNPRTLGVARLATMANLYERYKFRSLKFRYAPVANATISGQLLGYVDYDTIDNPTGLTGIQNLQRAAAHLGEKPIQVWEGSEKPVFWEIKDSDKLSTLYTSTDGIDPRWSSQGRFILLAASAIAGSVACGNIYLDYDIEFFIPQVAETASTGSGYKINGSVGNTQSNILGTAPVVSTWSNVEVGVSQNVLSFPAGSFELICNVGGTGLTSLTISSTGTIITQVNFVTGGQTGTINVSQLTSSTTFTVTMSMSATSISNAFVLAAQLPSNAVSLAKRRELQVISLLRQIGKEDREMLLQQYEEKRPIDPPHVPALLQSTSSVSSGSSSSVSSGWYHV